MKALPARFLFGSLFLIFSGIFLSGCLGQSFVLSEELTAVDALWSAQGLPAITQQFPHTVFQSDSVLFSIPNLEQHLIDVNTSLNARKELVSAYMDTPERAFLQSWIEFNVAWVNLLNQERSARDSWQLQRSTQLRVLSDSSLAVSKCSAPLVNETEFRALLNQILYVNLLFAQLQSQHAVVLTQTNIPSVVLNGSQLEILLANTFEVNSFWANVCTFANDFTRFQEDWDIFSAQENLCADISSVTDFQQRLQALSNSAVTLKSQAELMQLALQLRSLPSLNMLDEFVTSAREFNSTLTSLTTACQ